METKNFKFKVHSLGFTLLEFLIAIGILVILASIVTYAISSFKKEALLKDAKAKILNELNLARSKTLASDENSLWGVHFEPTKIVRFKGPSYSLTSPSNTEILFLPEVRIASILLGGPVDLTFVRLTGRASVSGTVVVELVSDTSRIATITIYSSGIAE